MLFVMSKPVLTLLILFGLTPQYKMTNSFIILNSRVFKESWSPLFAD